MLAGLCWATSHQALADEAAERLIEIQAVHQQAAIESMHAQDKADPHLKWTVRRKPAPGDEDRAAEALQTIRQAIEPYRNYRVALNKGYRPFQPGASQPYYHFTKKLNRFKAALTFDLAQPTSLLYRKTDQDYELVGVLYAMSKDAREREFNEVVPLSVAQWHAHVNVCIPPKGNADWAKFGVKGSIATEAECRKAGGQFIPQLFGWMLPVFPFEDAPEKIWALSGR
jgi:hypothetical protein